MKKKIEIDSAELQIAASACAGAAASSFDLDAISDRAVALARMTIAKLNGEYDAQQAKAAIAAPAPATPPPARRHVTQPSNPFGINGNGGQSRAPIGIGRTEDRHDEPSEFLIHTNGAAPATNGVGRHVPAAAIVPSRRNRRPPPAAPPAPSSVS